jgi:hypothetical protein
MWKVLTQNIWTRHWPNKGKLGCLICKGIPPYVGKGQVQSVRNGIESMNFTNYICYRYQEVSGTREGGK